VGNPHGGGDPIVIAIISVVLNTPLFLAVIQLLLVVLNRIPKLRRRI
jgi:hypothetical protein